MDPREFLSVVVLRKLNEARKMTLLAIKGGMSVKASTALTMGNCQAILTMLNEFRPEEGATPLPALRKRRGRLVPDGDADGAS